MARRIIWIAYLTFTAFCVAWPWGGWLFVIGAYCHGHRALKDILRRDAEHRGRAGVS